MAAAMGGPLDGVRVVGLGGIGPAPHAMMLLAEMGADCVVIERPGGSPVAGIDEAQQMLGQGCRTVALDLRDPDEVAALRSLLDAADVVIDGFRPGVTDRLGIGPAALTERNPRLVYGRVTGWGAFGPLSGTAGHDINFLALTGVLHAIRREGAAPTPPLNLLGDYGGGSMCLLVGVLAALYERERSGRGQVIDAAIVDGVSSLAQFIWSLRSSGQWTDEPASNVLDTGAPYYDVYECADGRFVAVGAVEPRFYALLIEGLGLDPAELPDREERTRWPALRERLARAFASRTRDEWVRVFGGSDACVTPVLSFEEARAHPHLRARDTITSVDGVPQAAPAPRFSRTRTHRPGVAPGERLSGIADVLDGWR